LTEVLFTLEEGESRGDLQTNLSTVGPCQSQQTKSVGYAHFLSTSTVTDWLNLVPLDKTEKIEGATRDLQHLKTFAQNFHKLSSLATKFLAESWMVSL
jgi:hypothetical protein